MQQLPLGLNWRHDATLDNFIVTDNPALIPQLRSLVNGALQSNGILLYGNSGAGRSHLLHATAQYADDKGQRVAVVSLSIPDIPVVVLEHLELCDLVCLDDVDAVANNADWSIALFKLFNAVVDRGGRLVVSSTLPPLTMDCALPDLRSRLQSLVVSRIPTLEDADRQQFLILRAEQKGLRVPVDVAQFLLQRQARDIPSLIALIDQLDKASLQEQRRLTIPFVKQVLGL